MFLPIDPVSKLDLTNILSVMVGIAFFAIKQLTVLIWDLFPQNEI